MPISPYTLIVPMAFERAGDFGTGLDCAEQCEGWCAGDRVLVERFETGGHAAVRVSGLVIIVGDQLTEPRMITIFLLEPGDLSGVVRQGLVDRLGCRGRQIGFLRLCCL